MLEKCEIKLTNCLIMEIGAVINIKFKNLYNPNSTTPKVIHNIGVINNINK